MNIQDIFRRTPAAAGSATHVPVAILGAEEAGRALAQTLESDPNAERRAVFFISRDGGDGDDVAGLHVYGVERAEAAIRRQGVREVILAIPGAESKELLELYNRYTALGCKVRVGESGAGRVRDFSVEDLLFHKPAEIDEDAALDYYRGKTVLVTGGGGCVGRELCRQLARFHPAKLVVLDVCESGAYALQQDLELAYGRDLDLCVEIGSVRDRRCLDSVFGRYKPQIVFHAAANNNVPLMEHNSAEAVKNNVFGTRNTADYAEAYGAEKFILLSADKAVRPTSVVGATKRLGELLVHSRKKSATVFAAVRFGNVLDSEASIVPLFRRQIAEGGPVTITDKRVSRYFITLAEAARLTVAAGVLAGNGEVLVLGTGRPVRIYDLAVNMIFLAGLDPDRDIEIREIGLRPGEKLVEELFMDPEHAEASANDHIFIEYEEPLRRDEIEVKVTVLSDAVSNGSDMRATMKRVIPTFQGD